MLFITSAKGNRAYPGKTSPRISIPRPLPLDNHCLRLDDGMKSNHLLTRIGTVFCHVLENAGVFKQDDEGRAAFLRFAEKVGFQKA